MSTGNKLKFIKIPALHRPKAPHLIISILDWHQTLISLIHGTCHHQFLIVGGALWRREIVRMEYSKILRREVDQRLLFRVESNGTCGECGSHLVTVSHVSSVSYFDII